MHQVRRSEAVAFSGYMPFVDGLRALAVVAVVLNHAHMPGFSGGFSGVDIFFVISGFLIIGQIRSEIARGDFSILRFYARRTLRILPVFFLVLACTFLAAPFFLFIPDAYESFAKSAIAAPLMISNVLFYVEQGYFDTAAQLKPLLHTWTLSVEEQFYLVVPLLLLGLAWLAKRGVRHVEPLAAVVIFVLSLVACIIWTDIGDRNPAFYLTPFRAWEFVAGGMIVPSLAQRLARLPVWVLEALGLAGMAMIAVTVAGVSEDSIWPGSLALLPVIGTSLVIAVSLARPEVAVARLLSMRLPVAIGLVSYGWYLWHWPLLAFGRMSNTNAGLSIDLLLGGILGLGLATVSYLLVEKPVRQWRKRARLEMNAGRIFASGFAGVFLMAALGGGITYAGYLANDRHIRNLYATEGAGTFDNGCRVRTGDAVPEHCVSGDYVLILGDSHADALYPALAQVARGRGLNAVSLARGGCRLSWFSPRSMQSGDLHRCSNLVTALKGVMAEPNPPRSVLVTSIFLPGTVPDKDEASELIRQFTDAGVRVLLIGPTPRFDQPALDCIHGAERTGGDKQRCNVSRAQTDSMFKNVVPLLRSAAGQVGAARVIDIIPAFCDDQVCRPDENGVLFFRDRDHLYPAGVHRLVEQYRDDFAWALGQ
ncbi:acyltransferase family protein [Zhengella sp. ZM62]|uniref:acyltransferase family protein n=1 Tax=Zhengella sedimenti TaxID=3390035 RepID=UPI0039759BF1